MIVEFDRASVCMGDDCNSHIEKFEFAQSTMISTLMQNLVNYVPTMHNVVWVVTSLNSRDTVIGFIVTDGFGKAEIQLNIPDMQLCKQFPMELSNIAVFCQYYHQSSFSWVDGKTGNRINQFSECKTLLEKVKKHWDL